MLNRSYFQNMTVVEQGEANEWAILDGKRWVASFRMNGEFMPKRQEEYVRIFAVSRAAYYALDLAHDALVAAYGEPEGTALEAVSGMKAIEEVRAVLRDGAYLPIAKPADLAATSKAVGGGAYPAPRAHVVPPIERLADLIDDAAPGVLRPDTRLRIASHVRAALSAPEDEKPCPVCGNEERGQGGYLSCECPSPQKREESTDLGWCPADGFGEGVRGTNVRPQKKATLAELGLKPLSVETIAERLQEALEGELDGLTTTTEIALRIASYILTGQDPDAPENPAPNQPPYYLRMMTTDLGRHEAIADARANKPAIIRKHEGCYASILLSRKPTLEGQKPFPLLGEDPENP